jgi:HlyD family secretion protein
MNKTLKILIIVAVIAIAGIIIGKKSGTIGEKLLIKVYTEQVKPRTITETITASGKIQPKTEVKISADVSGEIIELYVEDGDSVKQGQLLLKIKPDIYLSQIERLEATVNSSKAQLSQAQAQLLEKENAFNRSKILWQKKTISDAEYEAAEIAFKVAKANLDAAQFSVHSSMASLKEARENLIKTQIYSPINGIVTKLNVEKGERVVGTAQMTGTEIMRIADLNKMEVKVDVNENDIINVSKNDTAIIEVDAYLGKKFKGIVTEIANSASGTTTGIDQVTNFEVKVKILPSSYKFLQTKTNPFPFRPGMSASVDIQTQTVYNVLSVPIQAVTAKADSLLPDSMQEHNSELQEIVFVAVDNKAKIRKVKTGIQDDKFIQILSGLNENENVISAPYMAISRKLKNNSGIEIVKNKENLY